MELHEALSEATQIPGLTLTDVDRNGGVGGTLRLWGEIGDDVVVLDAGEEWTVRMPDTSIPHTTSPNLPEALGLLASGFRAEYERALARFKNFQSLIDSENNPFDEDQYGGSFKGENGEASDPDPEDSLFEGEDATPDFEELLDGLSNYRRSTIRRLPLWEAIPTLAAFIVGGEEFSPGDACEWLSHINYRLRNGRVIRGNDTNVHMSFTRMRDSGTLARIEKGVYRVSAPNSWKFKTANS